MKKLIPLVFALLLSCKDTKRFDLPQTWENNFYIHIYSGGGMAYESFNVWFNKDSCKYVHMEQGIDTVKRFSLSREEQKEVLDKLRDLHVEYIKTEENSGTVNDKETTSICFSSGQNTHCIETGAATYVQEKYAGDFNDAYMYLYRIALAKAK